MVRSRFWPTRFRVETEEELVGAISRRQFVCWGLAGAGLAATGGLLGGCASSSAGIDESSSSVSLAQTGSGASAVSADPLTATEFLFDTIITLTVYGSQEALDAAVERCRYFENTFSRTVEGSDVWRINEAAGQPVEVASETADLITQALGYCAASEGLFDITIGSVSTLWDFKEGVRPDDEAIAEAVKHIDYRGVTVAGSTVQLADPAAKIDLGGIAKGYIADDLKRLLAEQGVESACLNLGGNVAVLGAKPDGSPWNVGIQDPNGAAQDVIAAVPCVDGSVVTSGLYERQFVQDGTLYYHILDPRTGYPVETDVVSSSLLTDSSTDGDAYATLLFLMGRDEALALVNGDECLEGLVVDDAGTVTLSSQAPFELIEEA